MATPKRMNFRKSSKEGRGGGSFSLQIKFKLHILYLSTVLFEHEGEEKKIATWFSKNEGGGYQTVKGCLELFRKFVRFGVAIRPLFGVFFTCKKG